MTSESESVNLCPVCGWKATLWRTVVPGQIVIACRNREACGIRLDSRRINGTWETEKELLDRWNRLGREE